MIVVLVVVAALGFVLGVAAGASFRSSVPAPELWTAQELQALRGTRIALGDGPVEDW